MQKFSNATSQIGDDRPLSYCSFSPDSSMVATASWSGLAKLWHLPSCEMKTILKGKLEQISPSGQYITENVMDIFT